jgi:uridine kinase
MQKDIKEKGMKNEMEHPDIKKFIEHKKKLADFAIEHHEGDKKELHKSELWKKIQKHVHSKVFEPSADL